jgi:hypothetical protein
MYFPSGDHCGSRSITELVLVKLRASPFSAGTVITSPRDVNSARAPVGEIAGDPSRLPTVTRRVRSSGKSPCTRMGTALDFRS